MVSRLNVDAPSFASTQFGLLAVADDRPTGDVHWQTGVTYESWCGQASTTYSECIAVTGSGGSPPIPTDKTGTHEREVRGATSFAVYARLDCTPVGFWDTADRDVAQALTRTEQFQVERAFWTGVAANTTVVFPHLAADAEVTDDRGIVLQTAADTVTGGAHDPVIALGILEEALIDCYGGQGVIHVPLTLLPALGERRLVERSGSQLRTLIGNVVVAGGGYTGSGPDGTPATDTSAWMYATGPVFMYRANVNVYPREQSLDREKNTLEMIAERTYLLGWECCHIGVNVNKIL